MVRNEIDEVVKKYYGVIEEELYRSIYNSSWTDELVLDVLRITYKYFKAGFLSANIYDVYIKEIQK